MNATRSWRQAIADGRTLATTLSEAEKLVREWWGSKLKIEAGLRSYSEIDESGRMFTRDNLASPNPRESLRYDVRHPATQQFVPKHENGWRLSRQVMNERVAQGRTLFAIDYTTTPRFKRLPKDMNTQAIQSAIPQERARAIDALVRLFELAGAVSSVKPNRTEGPVVSGPTEYGLGLREPITVENVDGRSVLAVSDDTLIACFADERFDDIVRAIATRHPLRCVFKEFGLASNAAGISGNSIPRVASRDRGKEDLTR